MSPKLICTTFLPGEDAGLAIHGQAALGGQDQAGHADGRGVWELGHEFSHLGSRPCSNLFIYQARGV